MEALDKAKILKMTCISALQPTATYCYALQHTATQRHLTEALEGVNDDTEDDLDHHCADHYEKKECVYYSARYEKENEI